MRSALRTGGKRESCLRLKASEAPGATAPEHGANASVRPIPAETGAPANPSDTLSEQPFSAAAVWDVRTRAPRPLAEKTRHHCDHHDSGEARRAPQRGSLFNDQGTERTMKVLMVLTSHDQLGNTGRK